MTDQSITASRLRDGAVVWLAADGGWTDRVGEAAVYDETAASAALTAAAEDEARQIVIAPYAVDVDRTASGPLPTRLRERIRAHGPTIRIDAGTAVPKRYKQNRP